MEPENSAELMNLIRAKYTDLDDSGTVEIIPANLAASIYSKIDPHGLAPELVRIAAILQLRVMARRVCAELHRASEYLLESTQKSLFDFKLQSRYPTKRSGDDAYVLREAMTLAERRENSQRLRSEAKSKAAHANALDAETEKMVAQGKFGKVA